MFMQNLSILQLQRKEVFATEEIRPPATSELRDEPTEEPNICEVKNIPISCYIFIHGIFFVNLLFMAIWHLD